MQGFVQYAAPAIAALDSMGAQLDTDLRALLSYYGEDAASAKPEDLFTIFVSFSSALVVCVALCFTY